MKKHVMLDLETLGTSPGSVILSIGAVRFDENGLGDTFHKHIDPEDCLKLGMTVDASTIFWWMAQSEEARNNLLVAGKYLLMQTLYAFSSWFAGSEYLWGNGAAFDNALLSAAYRSVDISFPWEFWNDRCFRTVRAENPHVSAPEFEGVKHNALDDACHQARHLIKIWETNRCEHS